MDIIGILTLGAFLWVAGWQFGKWLYKTYASTFVQNLLRGPETIHYGIDQPIAITEEYLSGIGGDCGVCAPPAKDPLPSWSYGDTNYPSDELILLNNYPLAIGDFIIAQKAIYINGKRSAEWMDDSLKIIEILPAHIVFQHKNSIRYGFPNGIMSKNEFFAHDFRHLTEAEKKYLAW